MKANIKAIFLFDKVASFLLYIIPSQLLNSVKDVVIGNKRSNFLSNTSNFFERRIHKATNNWDLLCKKYDYNLKDKKILEFGTGGHGVDLIYLYLLGAKEMLTVDIGYFGFRYMRQAIIDFENQLSLIANTFHFIDDEEIRARYKKLKSTDSVDEALEVMNIRWCSFDDFVKALNEGQKYPHSETFDLFFSESNLQRIPLRRIELLLKHGVETLKTGGVIFHRMDVGDINCQKTRPLYDPNLWRFEFLKYSNKKWNRLADERLSSQNRMRQPEYIRLFSSLGVGDFFAENYLYKSDFTKINTFKSKLDERFKSFTDRENIIAHFRLLGIKGGDSSKIEESDIVFENRQGFGAPNPKWSQATGLVKETRS